MSAFPVKFGKYLLLERVNVGGMAEVFKAKTFGVAGFERILAVKRILPNLVEDEEFIRMFIDEARIAVQLNHTNVVQIYELGKHGEHYYIAMEYLASRDLRAILDRMRGNGQLMSIPQAAYITSKVCEGLDYAHKRRDPSGNAMNIIHRDVSPQNILIGFEGEVKVIDFGIAKAANRASKTQAGVLKGKFGYMSPEQVRGLPTDRRSDIFAVGVLLYEMLTGERLFIGESDFSTLERVRNAEVTPPTKFNKKITPRLEEVVLKALAREVEDRYPWASELADELQPFLKEDAKTVFNMKRLAVLMRDTYSGEIAAEKAKLEEFLRVNPDEARAERGNANALSSVLPLHEPAPAAAPKVPPPTRAMVPKSAPQPPIDEDSGEDEAAGFGEDKTFVIEASQAGLALQATQAPGPGSVDPRAETSLGDELPPEPPAPRPRSGAAPASAGRMVTPPRSNASLSGKSMTSPRGEKRPNTANEQFLEQVSLYGDDAGDEDESRTQVSAQNPFYNPEPAGTDESDIDASELNDPDPVPSPPPRDSAATRAAPREDLSDAPTMAASAPDVVKAARDAQRRAERTGQSAARAAADPVAAAMDEEERLALEILKGTTGGRASSKANASAPAAHGDDFAGRQFPVTDAGNDRTELGPPIATDTAAELPPVTNSFVPGPHTPPNGEMPDTMPPQAVSPQMIRLIFGATAASAVIFLVVVGALVLRLTSGAAASTVVLFAVGDARPSGDVVVKVDGAEVGNALPAQFQVKPGAHTLRVEGKGVRTVERPLKVANVAMKQPVLFIAADAEAPANPIAVENPTPSGAVTPDPASGPKLAMRVPPPVSGGWRLSLAAVADDTGRPIADAEILIDNQPYGSAPFEAEIDSKKEKVEVRVRAEGYETRSIDVERSGRAAVGPATVRMTPSKGASAAVLDPAAPNGTASGTAPSTSPGTTDPAPPDPAPKPASASGTQVATSTQPPAQPPTQPSSAQPTAQPSAQPAAQPSVRPATQPSAQPAAQPPKPVAARDPAPAAAPAAAKPDKPKTKLTKLEVGTRPVMQLSLDGKVKGTKLFYGPEAVELSIGTHSLELVDKNAKKTHRLKVTVTADDPKNKLIFDGGSTPPVIRTSGAVTAKLQ